MTGSYRPKADIGKLSLSLKCSHRRSQFLRHKTNTGDSSSWGGAVLPGTLPVHLLACQSPQLIKGATPQILALSITRLRSRHQTSTVSTSMIEQASEIPSAVSFRAVCQQGAPAAPWELQ